MSNRPDQLTISITRDELEALLRRIVREELAHLLEARKPSVLDDLSREGPDDPNGDAALLEEVLAMSEREQNTPIPRIAWETAKAELARV